MKFTDLLGFKLLGPLTPWSTGISRKHLLLGDAVTVVAIEPLSRVSCRITFDSVNSRMLAVSDISNDPLCKAGTFVITAVEGATAVSSLNSDDTERELRIRFHCRLLHDILIDAAAKCGYGSGDAGLAAAWFDLVNSQPFRDAVVARAPNHHGDWMQSIDIDARDGVPLHNISSPRAEMYREWSRSPFFIRLGEEWLARLSSGAL